MSQVLIKLYFRKKSLITCDNTFLFSKKVLLCSIVHIEV
jgi:hypothetical protein